MSVSQSTEHRIQNLVTDVLQTSIPSTTANLIDSGILDSLGFVEIIARLEREFGIHISLETVEIGQLQSVESIARFVAGRLASASCPR